MEYLHSDLLLCTAFLSLYIFGNVVRCSLMKLGEYRCVLGIGMHSVKSAFQAQCGSEIALITSQKMD